MGFYTSPIQLAVAQRSRFRRVILLQEEVHELLASFGHEDMQGQTQGPIKEKSLRAMGHPYARQRVKTPGAARGIVKGEIKAFRRSAATGQISAKGMVQRLPINSQTGKLRQSIKLAGPRGPQKVYDLAALVPYAKFVLSVNGTRYMVPRGLLGPTGLLRKRHKARVQVLINEVRLTQKRP